MRAFLGIAALAALAACTADEGVDLGVGGAMSFQQNCAVCHGADGRGGGPLGASLLTEPPDLTRIAARNGGAFPRLEVLSVIDGYHRDDRFSAAMPEFGARDLGPMVALPEGEGAGTPVPLGLLELVIYLESLQRP